jgi:DNA-binding HxlR family transcriptional regulator
MPDAEELETFLSGQGSVEILLWLSDEPRRFTDLYERVDVARATLSKRLQRGVELGLWNRESEDDSGDTGTETYRITDRGDALLTEIDREAAVRHLQSLYNARRDFESDREGLLDSVSDADVGSES